MAKQNYFKMSGAEFAIIQIVLDPDMFLERPEGRKFVCVSPSACLRLGLQLARMFFADWATVLEKSVERSLVKKYTKYF